MLKWADRIRCACVDRWHSVATRRKQNLAEHHYSVTQIAIRLADDIMPGLVAEDKLALIEYCLNHDLPEILASDLASTSKVRLRALGCGPALEALEYEIFPELKGMAERLEGTPLKDIAKLADMADAISFIRQEGHGNSEARIARSMIEVLRSSMAQTLGAETVSNVWGPVSIGLRKPVSHSDMIEQKLMVDFKERVGEAARKFPDLNWDAATNVLTELTDAESSHLDFEKASHG